MFLPWCNYVRDLFKRELQRMLTFEKLCSNKATISVYIGSTCIRFQDILLELLGKKFDHVTFLRVCFSGVGDVALSFGTLFSYVEFQILGIVFFLD